MIPAGFDAAAFIAAQTVIESPSILPELKLHIATEVTPLWQSTEDELNAKNIAPPFWAFAWPGGQGVARYLMDNPAMVRGKRVMDFAAGSGMGAIACLKAGAASAIAVDIDMLALTVIRMNGLLNGMAVLPQNGVDMTTPPADTDLIIAGDVCYQKDMAEAGLRWLRQCVAAGIRVILGDPGRAYAPKQGIAELARYTVPTTLDLESTESREVRVFELLAS